MDFSLSSELQELQRRTRDLSGAEIVVDGGHLCSAL